MSNAATALHNRFFATAPAPGIDAGLLLGQYRGGIYGVFRRRGFGAEEADDLTQETLLRAYQHLPGFRGASVAPWLFRIARNLAVDQLRKTRPATIPLEDLSLAAEDEDPLLKLTTAERQAEVLSMVESLPARHRKMIWLRYFEDHSLQEIAAATGCSPGIAKQRIFRAVTALRKSARAALGDA